MTPDDSKPRTDFAAVVAGLPGLRALWDVFVARRRFDRLAKTVSTEEPWAAERATALDAQTPAARDRL